MDSRLRRYHYLLHAAIYPLPLFALWAAWAVEGALSGRYLALNADFYHFLLFNVIVWAVVATREEVVSISKLSAEHTGVRAASAACFMTCALDAIYLYLFRSEAGPRLLVVIYALALWALTVLVRMVVRQAIRAFVGRRPCCRVLIFGAGRSAVRVAARVRSNKVICGQVVGYIPIPNEPVCATGSALYSLSDIEAIEKLNVDNILIAVSPEQYGFVRKAMKALAPLCKPMNVVVYMGGGLQVKDRVLDIGGLQMLNLAPGRTFSSEYIIAKRCLDIAFSSVFLLLAAIPMAVIALAVKLSSPGPILFRQQRVGRHGKLFTMYKFRSMRVAPAQESDAKWSSLGDPRRTWLGEFLRKSSLDELPQFFNVLFGHMSIVGPRPERPYFVQRFRKDVAFYHDRHHIDVGITGWAQVNGLRGDTSIRKRVQYDLYYLQHWSILFDLKIMWLTLVGGFTGKNAY